MPKKTAKAKPKETKKVIKKPIQKFRSSRFNPFGLAVFAVVMGVAGYFIFFSHAAPPPPTIYLSPVSATVGSNGTFTVQIRENSSTTTVNAAQANFSFPSSLLTCTAATSSYNSTTKMAGDISLVGGGFTTVAQTDCSSGQVKIGLGTAGATSITGDQLLATVTFHSAATGGAAPMAFISGTALVSSTTNADILGSLAATGGGSYTVDVNPPTVSVTAPLNGATPAFGSNIAISATASDAETSVSKVEIYTDGSLKTTLTTSPYNYTWSGATLGAHTISAKAYDVANNVTTSSTINLTVTDQTAPTVNTTAPSNGAFIKGTVSVTATASDNVAAAGVQFKLDGANLQAEDTTSPYSISWDTTTATNGSHTLSAVARDAAGNTTTSSVTVTVDNSAPTASMTAPTNSSFVKGTINVTANASDNTAVTSVQFKLDGANLGAAVSSAPYTTTWNTTTATNGTVHTLSAVASDAAGNTVTATSVSVTVDNAAPTGVAVTAPAASSFVSGNAVTISGSASDNIAVTSVQFKLDGVNFGAALTSSPYNVTWDTTTATNGSHSLSVVASDAAGNTTTSATVSLTVDNVAPTVSITAPTAGATVAGTTTVNATATDNTGGSGINKVEFYVDGSLSSTDTTSPYSFSWNTTTASFGSHSLTAKAYDKATTANVTTSAAVSVTVDNTDHTAPSTPGSLAAASLGVTSVNLSWIASTDNIGVTGYQLQRNGTTIATLPSTALSYNDTGLTPSTTYSYNLQAFDAAGNFSTGAVLAATTKAQLPGDINLDGTVSITDLSIQLGNWNSTTRPDCDLNNNGTVDIFDLSILLTNYGKSS